MARFEIKSKDGNSIRYSGKPRYNGSYLKPAFIEFSEISSPTPIAWEVGDYLDYSRTGMRYYLYSIPQPSKKARSGANGGSFTYSNVQLFSATKDLEIALFRDLVSNDNNIHFSTSPDVATFENVEGIARRIQACLNDLYPGKWEIRLAEFSADEDAELIESISTAKDFALSGGTCLDALSKIYELWDNLGWIHSYENGKEVITIGYANKRIDANTTDSYLYGKGNGLTAIKKNQTNKDEFATRLYVYGSERNLPARYYNDKEILNAESVDIRNLMLPLDSWGKTDGLPDARKAYLENAEAVAKFGVIPKTHYFDSEDAGADIYPTIERLTIGEIRSVMQSTDEYYPTDKYADEDRADAISDAENPTDDGVINPNGKEYDAKSYLSIQSHDKKVNMVGGLQTSPLLTDYLFFSKVVVADIERAKVVIDLSETITIPDRGFTSVSAKLMIGDDEQAGYGTAVGFTTLVGVKSEDGKNWEIKLGRISAEYGKSELYDNTEYHIYGHISITANTIGVESGETTIKFGPGSGSIGLKRILDKTFRLNLRQIGFNINDQAALGNGKTISMKTGACAGRNFVISGCTYSSALDAWRITCKRQQDDTLGMLFPNNSYEIAEGDTFVLLDIAMPELYVSVAQNRLLAEGQKLLSRASKIQSNYEPSIDAKVMVESGRNLREGMFMEISDEDIVDGIIDYILIDSLSIYEDESAIPTYKVTLREKKKVSYKGTPSATSANDTKSVEDETEEQVNVDLTGYAKETYVDEKVSEVKNALDAIWSLDENGNLVTEKQVIVKNNIIISGDTSTGGTGQDVPSGIDEAQLKEYLDTNKYITSDYAYSKEEVNRLIDEVNAGDIDLTNYYTKEETASEISKAIEGIDIPSLDGYATEKFVSDSITGLNVGQYATKTALETLQGEVDNIESVLGMGEEAEGVINTWNEVKAFLAEIEVGDDLASILEGINTRIGNNTTAIGLIDGRVTVNESAISDNATNIRNAKGEIDGLKDTKADWGTTLAHYGITDAYTKTEVAAELAKYLLLESANQTIKGNITIEGNLIVKGDTSSTAKGSNSGTDGTLIGVIVNGTRYEDETNGMLDLSTLMNQYALATEIPSLDDYAKLTDIPTTMAWTAITGKPSFASVATSGSYNDLSNKPTIPTTLPASDVYPWAKAATKPSYKTSEVAEENNLYFTNARAVNALADTLKDYVTKTALASDLGEYASKEWVNEKGYITGITLTGDDYISVNGYKLSLAIDAQGGLTNTGQGLGIYQIPSARIVTDALGYTPLSTGGGTISGANTRPLVINSTSSDKAVELRLQKNGVLKADIGHDDNHGVYIYDAISNRFMGINTDGTPYYHNGSYKNTLYHTGNFNPADYLPLSGGTIESTSTAPLTINSKNTNDDIEILFKYKGDAVGFIGLYDGGGFYMGHSDKQYRIGVRKDGVPVYKLGYNGTEYRLIHENNIGSYNAGSATKLANKRTIWGREFDGSGNVDGILTLNYSTASRATGVEVVSTNGAEASIGFKLDDTNRAVVGAWYSALNLWTATKKTVISIPIATGNVLIGKTTDGGYKFDVSGTARISGAVTMSSTFTAGGGTLSGTLYSTANHGFNVTRTSDWAYYQLKSGSVAWDIATTATASSSNIKHANALEFRSNGDGDWGFSLRPKTSSFGVGVLVSNTGECSLGFLSSSSSSSDKKPQWVMGALNTTEFGVYNTARSKYGFTIDDYFKLSTNSITIRGEARSYINNRAVLVLNSASKQAADIVFKCNSSTTGDYGQWAISSRSENDGRFSIFRGAQNIAVASEEELFTIKANGDVKIAKNLIIAGDMSSTSDMRLKQRIEDVILDLNTMAEMPIFTFRWKDGMDDRLHLGSSAQYWEKPAPWLVMGDETKTLNYAVLGVAGVKTLAVTAVDHETRIKMLERKVNELETENRRLRYGN